MAQELETNQNRYHFATIYSNGLNRPPHNTPAQLSSGRNQQNARQNTSNQQSTHSQSSQGYFGQQNVPFYQNRTQQPYYQPQQHSTANSKFHSHPNPRGFGQHISQISNQQVFNPPQISQPIDTDVSMRTVRSNNFHGFHAQKRDTVSDRQIPRKIHRINHIEHEILQEGSFEGTYECQEDSDIQTYQDPLGDQACVNPVFEDEVNFLEMGRYSPSLRE